MADETDPLLTKRKKRARIGFSRTQYICLKCEQEIDSLARPYVDLEELVEGDDAGFPFECYKCGAELGPANEPTQVES